MLSPISICSFGIFVNTALSTFHFPQEIHPGHGGPPPSQPVEPPLSSQNLDSSSFAKPQQGSGPQRLFNDRPPHQGAAAVIYPADAPSPSSPEHDINESHSSLSALCRDSDSSLSTIVLGSITSFNPSNGFPIADFSAAGCTRARHPRDPWAPGLAKCPELGDEVRRCQELGRKVVLRIGSGGGAGGGKHGEVEGPIDGTTTTSTTTTLPTEEEEQLASALWFRDAPDARRAAVNLWKLFGQGDTHGPTGADSMRPLGEGVVVDGFDLAPSPSDSRDSYFGTFASTLHDLAHKRTNRTPCHISTTPACLPSTLFSNLDRLDEVREAVDVVYTPATMNGQQNCKSHEQLTVQQDSSEAAWRAATEKWRGGESADGSKQAEKEEDRDEGKDELKV
ncbi:hypothetical protein IWZ00DRAFT_334312 [Phyllosticta capitalensis]